MNGYSIENTNDRFIITIDKNNFTEEVLLDVCKMMRPKYLICKADFDEAVLEIGEEIRKDWWEKNKSTFIQPNE